MPLTNAQLQTLKTAIIADPVAGPIRDAGDTVSLLAWCNGVKTPNQLAWRNNVPIQDSDEAATYTAYDSLVAGKRDSWGIYLKFNRDFSKNKIRNWITDVWGNATTGSISEAILLAGAENATNAQAIIGGPTRTTGTVSAIARNFTDSVSDSEVNRLVN